jgi:hypothetical protein
LLENEVKKCGKEYDEQSTKFKPRQEETNQLTCNFLEVCHQNIRGLFGKNQKRMSHYINQAG